MCEAGNTFKELQRVHPAAVSAGSESGPWMPAVAGHSLGALAGPPLDTGAEEPALRLPKPGRSGQQMLNLWEMEGPHLLAGEWAESQLGVTVQVARELVRP